VRNIVLDTNGRMSNIVLDTNIVAIDFLKVGFTIDPVYR
jgi:hypothetical protein